MGILMGGKKIKDFMQYAALNGSQFRLRRLDQPERAIIFFYKTIEIMLKHRNGGPAMLPFLISEPIELRRRYVQPIRQIALSPQLRNFQLRKCVERGEQRCPQFDIGWLFNGVFCGTKP